MTTEKAEPEMPDDNSLETRVRQFELMGLPGQFHMHMGTAYLVSDLWKEVTKLRAGIEAMRTAPNRWDAQSVRDATIEECAKKIEPRLDWDDSEYAQARREAAAEVRALAETKATQGAKLATLILEYARDLRRNSSGGDDYPWEYAKATADYLEELVRRSETKPALYNALRDIISVAKDAHATDALGDIVKRAEEGLGND